MDIKLFAKNEKELEILLYAVKIYIQDIGMEFGREKYAMLLMKSGKRHPTDGMELPNQDKIRTLGEKEIYKCLGILKADTIKEVERNSHYILPMKNMTNQNITPCETHTRGLGVMIGKFSIDSKHGDSISILRIVTVLFPCT